MLTAPKPRHAARRVATIVVVAVLCVAGPALADSTDQLMAVAVTVPGSSTANDTPVLLFRLTGSGALVPLARIPATVLDDPGYVAFGPSGELFVANRHGNAGPGSIARFKLGPGGEILEHTTITGNGLSAVHGLVFSRAGDLFAGNRRTGRVSQFHFGSSGEPVPAGTFFAGFSPQGLAFDHHGELHVSREGSIARFLVDPVTGAVTPHGSYTLPGPVAVHGVAFFRGQEFVADPYTDSVFRVGFHGFRIPVAGGPVGVVFSRAGELFVSSHFEGRISRFTFAADGTAIAGPSIPITENLGGIALRRPMPICDHHEATLRALPGQRITGTPGDDVIVGTAGDDTIDGGGGSDRICGAAGDDTLQGGDGADVVRGDEGADVLGGGADGDLLAGAEGDDRLTGGPGDDRLYGSAGADWLDGGEGSDSLWGGREDDVLDGGADDDQLDGGPDSDTCSGGPGINVVRACSP